MSSITQRIASAEEVGLYDDDANNHQVLAKNRDVAITHALRALRDAANVGGNGRELIIVAGSTDVYNMALRAGFAAHVVRPILEEFDSQREARLTAASTPHCLCTFSQLSPGPTRCIHHGFDDPVILVCDALAYLDPRDVRDAVYHYGSGKIVCVQMWEGGQDGAWDPTGTGECIQVYDQGILTAYVAGNNGAYRAPTLRSLYPPGNTIGVSLSIKRRIGLVQVITLGTCQYSAVGYTGEVIPTCAKYETAFFDGHNFIFVAHQKVNEILYSLECVPSLKVDLSKRNETVARQKCAALLSQVRSRPFSGMGGQVSFLDGLAMSSSVDDALGKLVVYVLSRHANRVGIESRARLWLQRLRFKLGFFGQDLFLTSVAAVLLGWAARRLWRNYSTKLAAAIYKRLVAVMYVIKNNTISPTVVMNKIRQLLGLSPVDNQFTRAEVAEFLSSLAQGGVKPGLILPWVPLLQQTVVDKTTKLLGSVGEFGRSSLDWLRQNLAAPPFDVEHYAWVHDYNNCDHAVAYSAALWVRSWSNPDLNAKVNALALEWYETPAVRAAPSSIKKLVGPMLDTTATVVRTTLAPYKDKAAAAASNLLATYVFGKRPDAGNFLELLKLFDLAEFAETVFGEAAGKFVREFRAEWPKLPKFGYYPPTPLGVLMLPRNDAVYAEYAQAVRLAARENPPWYSSVFPHPVLQGDSVGGSFAQLIYKSAPILVGPWFEEMFPLISVGISAWHACHAGFSTFNGSNVLWMAEQVTRGCLALNDYFGNGKSYGTRVFLHSCRNFMSVAELAMELRKALDGGYVMSYWAALPSSVCDKIIALPMAGFVGENFFRIAMILLGLNRLRPLVMKKFRQWRRVYNRLPADEKYFIPFGEYFGFEPAAQPDTASEHHRRLIEDGVTSVVDPKVIASAPGNFAPEWRGDLKLVNRKGWTVSVEECFNGLHRRDMAVTPGTVGLTVLTYANGMTPRNAAGNNIHDYVQMAIGRILDIEQRDEVTMDLTYAAVFVQNHFERVRNAAGITKYSVPELGSPAFDELATDFVEHFPVTRIREKWKEILEEWKQHEYDTQLCKAGVYSVFLKLESWWKLAAKGGAVGGKYVAHKPRCIWVPDERRVLVSSIATYGVAKHFKSVIATALPEARLNIIYTSSMTGEQVGQLVYEFGASAYDPKDSATWFLLLVNGDDNWMRFHPQFVKLNPRCHEALKGWATRMREIGRNAEPQLAPLFASSFSSSRFMPALRGKEHTLVLAPCFARAACKLGTTLSALPRSRLLCGGVPSTEGFLMWLRRVYDISVNYVDTFSYDPLGRGLFAGIREHMLYLLDGRLEGPVLRQGEREVMSEDYQFRTEEGLEMAPGLYELSISQWFGMPYSDVVTGVDEILEAWSSIKWQGGALSTGHVESIGCSLFMRGLGNHGPGVPGYRPENFIDPKAGEKVSSGVCDVPAALDVPNGFHPKEHDGLTVSHLAKFLARLDGIIVAGSRVGKGFLEAVVTQNSNVTMHVVGKRAGNLAFVGGRWCGRRVAKADVDKAPVVYCLDCDDWTGVGEQKVIFIQHGSPTMWVDGILPILPPFQSLNGTYAMMGTMNVLHIGDASLPQQPQRNYNRREHQRLLAFACAAGLPHLINPECADWSFPSTGLLVGDYEAEWNYWAFENDSAAFDNSTVMESLRKLIDTLSKISNWEGRSRWLLDSLPKGAIFRARSGLKGTARVCWPSGIPLTSFGGSLMNAQEFIECLRQCLETENIALPLPLTSSA